MSLLTITSSLNVIDKYNQLLDESFAVDSVYIRTKDTLADLIVKGNLDNATSAKIISEVLANLNNSLVNAVMGTSLDWAKSEKSIEMQLAELQYKLDLLDQEKLMNIAKTNQINAQIRWGDLESNKMYGPGGKIDKEIELMTQQILNAQKEIEVTASKIKESQASIYKIVADTMANFGTASYTISEGGVNGSVQLGNAELGNNQINIARKQAAGYAYNAWANASQALSSVVSMQMSDTTQSSNILDLLTITNKLASATV